MKLTTIHVTHKMNIKGTVEQFQRRFIIIRLLTIMNKQKIISLVPEGGNYKDLPEQYRGTRNFNVAWTRYHSKKPSLTIDTGHRHHFHYKANRVPTVRENARFQSFPDNFIFMGIELSNIDK